MTDDIVSILRQHALAADTTVEHCAFTDAADEIERLRAALEGTVRALEAAMEQHDNPFGIHHNDAMDAMDAARAALPGGTLVESSAESHSRAALAGPAETGIVVPAPVAPHPYFVRLERKQDGWWIDYLSDEWNFITFPRAAVQQGEGQ